MNLKPLTEENCPSFDVYKFLQRKELRHANYKIEDYFLLYLAPIGHQFLLEHSKKIGGVPIEVAAFIKGPVPRGRLPLTGSIAHFYYEIILKDSKRYFVMPYIRTYNLFVDSKYQQQGVGLAMLEAAYYFDKFDIFVRNSRKNPETKAGEKTLDAFLKKHPEIPVITKLPENTLKRGYFFQSKESPMKKFTIKTKAGERMIFSEFEIKKRKGKWVLLSSDGSVRGTHNSKEAAQRQLRAIHANCKQEAIEEARYSRQDIVNNISAVFQYLLWAHFEKKARDNFLSSDTEQAAMMLRQADTRKKVFSYLAGNLMRVVKDIMVSTFVDRYGMSAAEFDRYFDPQVILSMLSPGKSTQVSIGSSKKSEPEVLHRIDPIESPVQEALDEFDPEEKNWLSKQFDKIEKDLTDITLPDSPSDKEQKDALKPVDSREQQEDDSYFFERKKNGNKKKEAVK